MTDPSGRLEREIAEIGLTAGDITVVPLNHNTSNTITDAIERVTGPDWTAIRKVVTPAGQGDPWWAASTDPRHFNYWEREVLVYRTGLPERVGLAAPELHGIVDHPDGSVSLWLEAVDGRSGNEWDVEGLAAASHQLGVAQARCEVPDDPWLTTGYLGSYSHSKPANFALLDDDTAWSHPYIADNWPDSIRPGFQRLHAEWDRFVALSERLPRTFSHLDCWPNNMIGRPDGSAVFVDWSFCGDGSLGEDIGNLIPDAIFDLLLPPDDLPALEAQVLGNYLDGLAAGGWTGDERLVELGMWASAVKYVWLVPILVARTNDTKHIAYGSESDPDHLYRCRGAALDLLTRWAQRAETLAVALDLW